MGDPDQWHVPSALLDRLGADPDEAAWTDGLPGSTAMLATRWGLRGDGEAWSGSNSAVWPVRDDKDRALALKVSRPGWPIESEAVALQWWDGHGAVRCHAHSRDDNSLLLQRLDGNRSLDVVPDVDEACRVAASVLAGLHGVSPPEGFRHLAVLAQSLAEEIRQRSREPLPAVLTARHVDQALETFDGVAPEATDRLLHNDAHFLNVLASFEDGPGWRAIDPYPFVGPVEMEVVPLLRNRWADALGTGDPDRALRRRVDAVAEILGGDATRVRALAQAAAVVNLLALLPKQADHFFVPPYSLIADWTPRGPS